MGVRISENPVGMRNIESIHRMGFRKIAAIGEKIYSEGNIDRHVVYARMNDGEMVFVPCIESLERAIEAYIREKDTYGLEKIFERGESMAVCLQKREAVMLVFDFV